MSSLDLRSFVRDIPDFPREGIVFKDITPLLLDPLALDAAVTGLVAYAEPLGVDFVVAAEARGFLLGGALARQLGAGFVPARKPGKLPHDTVSAEYTLEYGINAGLDDPLFYGSIAAGFALAYPFAFLANRYLIARGKGHAVVHEHHGH